MTCFKLLVNILVPLRKLRHNEIKGLDQEKNQDYFTSNSLNFSLKNKSSGSSAI